MPISADRPTSTASEFTRQALGIAASAGYGLAIGAPLTEAAAERIMVLMALGDPIRDRRAERHAATRAEIIAAAWQVARSAGLAGLSLREVATAVGMRPPSLYSYFTSKADIYDAMFAEGYQQYIDAFEALDQPRSKAARVRANLRFFVEFATVDPARYQLLFQRTIPGFEPSPGSMALAERAYQRTLVEPLAGIGITDPLVFDLVTALGTGLSDQQISNDPGGDRWLRLVDEAADLLLASPKVRKG